MGRVIMNAASNRYRSAVTSQLMIKRVMVRSAKAEGRNTNVMKPARKAQNNLGWLVKNFIMI